jgi:putative addiction module component (TIGR02574 family)
MSTDAASEVLSKALALPEAERIRLAGDLLASVKPSGIMSIDDSQFEQELARRQQQLRDGTATAYSAEETIAAMRKAVLERRNP